MRPLRFRVACDDSEFRYAGTSPVCEDCRHRIGFDRLACAAFPDRIPKEIWNGLRDHRSPYPGDGGIRFEPMTAEDRERQRQLEEELIAWYHRRTEELRAAGKLKPRPATDDAPPVPPETHRAAG
jgi:hypothetical protein